MTVFISAIPIDGIAGMKKVTVTSALEIGCPLSSTSLMRTVLVPFCAGEGSVVNVILAFFVIPEAPSCAATTEVRITAATRINIAAAQTIEKTLVLKVALIVALLFENLRSIARKLTTY
jgi:hypothetical protein